LWQSTVKKALSRHGSLQLGTISHLEELHRLNPRTTIWYAAEQQKLKKKIETFLRPKTKRAASKTEGHAINNITCFLKSSSSHSVFLQ
jgi:hypothetical protein